MDQIEVAYSTLLDRRTSEGTSEWKEPTRALSKDGLEHPRIGIGDLENDKEVGFQLISSDDIDDLGIQEVIRRIRSRVGSSPVYLSLDIDVIDPGLAPATGTPEAGGWTTREMKRILRGLAGLNFIGVDIVEVAPAYDNAEITSIAAADFVTDFLSMLLAETSSTSVTGRREIRDEFVDHRPSMSQQSLETYVLTGSTKIIERFFELPLDYGDPDGQKIQVFARSMIPLDKAKTPEQEANLPYCTGGPGFEVDMAGYTSMATIIHKEGYQTLWLDQRGTGLSTPFSANLVSDKSDEEIFQYLKHFRADNIVRDCEAIRKILLGTKADEKDRKWTILGQSFGGFCCLTYLSFYPEGLKEVFITAGIPPLVDSPDTVYRALASKITTQVIIRWLPNQVVDRTGPGTQRRLL
ncbi:hypothetical protein C0993_002031 [Termitomyces sp. T159_Od127]|nr:hypothetical protein C0993_002031 [Termitomyces sp. T159_Od127]